MLLGEATCKVEWMPKRQSPLLKQRPFQAVPFSLPLLIQSNTNKFEKKANLLTVYRYHRLDAMLACLQDGRHDTMPVRF